MLLPLLVGCEGEQSPSRTRRPAATDGASPGGCQGCHPQTMDTNHAMPCTDCHAGNPNGRDQQAAHLGLEPHPAHPDRMITACGPCHAQLVEQAAVSSHFTLAGEINLTRAAFGASDDLAGPRELPGHATISSPLDLVDDLLGRRCLRCHVYNNGEPYSKTSHGSGCAACHLRYEQGRLQSHLFLRLPDDEQCLQCHYGNRVGADYYGYYERDLGREYRTPFDAPRPYGVESHQLAPDVHQQAGMTCIDCHPGTQLMDHERAEKQVTCLTCHSRALAARSAALLPNLKVSGELVTLRTKTGHQTLTVPLPTNPAHLAYGNQTDCVVCHAQWSFNDQPTHFIRLDADDYEPWEPFAVQGSSSVEELFATARRSMDEAAPMPTMPEGMTNLPQPGIWLKGYGQRRWESPLVAADDSGRLRLFRPLLDLSLSYVDNNSTPVMEGIRPTRQELIRRPYTPHTIGKAGLFFEQRLPADHLVQPTATR